MRGEALFKVHWEERWVLGGYTQGEKRRNELMTIKVGQNQTLRHT